MRCVEPLLRFCMLFTVFACVEIAVLVAQQASAAHGGDVPLPPARPSDIEGSPASNENTATPPDPACTRVLANDRFVAISAPPVSGPNGCGIVEPVRLEAVVLADGTQVPLEPKALVRCTFAEALGNWLRDDVAPLAEKASGLSKVLGSEGYECRTRDNIAGAKLSEHAKGNAFDLRGFALRNGQTFVIERAAEALDFMTQLKASACARFMTVLGPGSDSFHKTHLHVDLAERHNNYRICEWDVK